MPAFSEAVERILAAPSFLFRVEHPPVNAAAGSVYRLSDLDLASRFSFFLWGSVPDDELMNVAVRGKLKDAAVLEQQVQRMLRDPRSDALVNNFASRWLELSKIAGVVPDTDSVSRVRREPPGVDGQGNPVIPRRSAAQR